MNQYKGESIAFQVRYSAPGKSILSGEQSVVYNKNALVFALDLRTVSTLTVLKNQQNEGVDKAFTAEFVDENINYSYKQSELLSLSQYFKSIAKSKYSFQEFILVNQMDEKDSKSILAYIIFYLLAQLFDDNPLSITKFANYFERNRVVLNVKSDLPVSKGLGSSASFLVVLTASITRFILFAIDNCISGQHIAIQTNDKQFQHFVNDNAFEFEKIYHGTPSGIDNFITCFGGLAVFNKQQKQFKQFDALDIPYKIFLVDSGVEKNTKKAVAKVKEICDLPELDNIGQQSIDLIGKTTDKLIELLERGTGTTQEQLKRFIKIFDQLILTNQSLLRLFCLSNFEIEKIMAICLKYGVPGKITGAGQGGYCMVFIPKTLDQQSEITFLKELTTEQFAYMPANIAKQGLQLEYINSFGSSNLQDSK